MSQSLLVQSQVRFNRVLEKVSEKVPEKVPEKVSEKVPEKVWEALVQSQVRFNRAAEKVPEKVPGSLGAKPSQVQQGSGERSGATSGRFGAARSGSTGFAAILLPETQLRCFQPLASQHASERFVKIKRCGCWGYHQSLF